MKFLFYYDSRDIILTVTDSLMLLQHRIDGNGSVTELSKVCFGAFLYYSDDKHRRWGGRGGCSPP